MAIVKRVSRKGQNRTGILSGKLRIEDGNNRMVGHDGERFNMTFQYDEEIGTFILVIAKPGEDVFEALAE